MTILSDGTIRHHLDFPDRDYIKITPSPEDRAIQPASVDLTLGHEFIKSDGTVFSEEGWVLHRGTFLLGTTVERVRIPDNIVGRVEGKSSLGRVGVLVHATAGFIDPGFEGCITLEFSNLSDRPFVLQAGMYICQISFSPLDKPALRPYGHRDLENSYQNQNGVKESKYANR